MDWGEIVFGAAAALVMAFGGPVYDRWRSWRRSRAARR